MYHDRLSKALVYSVFEMKSKGSFHHVPVPKKVLWKQIVVLLPVYVDTFMMGCAIGWLPNSIYFFTNAQDEVSFTITDCSIIASIGEAGRLLSALPGGLFADKFGRKKVLTIIGILHFLSWFILSVSTSLMYIQIARFILGACSGLVTFIGPITIGETVLPEYRGKFTGAFQASMTFGMLFECLISSVFSSYKVLVYSTMVASLSYFLTMPGTMEIPRFLISISKYKEAKDIYKQIYSHLTDTQVDSELERMISYIDEENKRKREKSWLEFVRSKSIRKPLITGTLLEFFLYLSGVLVLLTFVSDAIPKNEYVSKKYYPLILTSIPAAGNICAIFILERFPRRTLYMTGCAIICVLHVVNGSTLYVYTKYNVEYCFIIIMAGNILLRVLIGVLMIPLQQTVRSEIFPQTVRGFGGALCTLAASLANIVSYHAYDFLSHRHCLYFLFMYFALCNVLLAVTVYTRLPEGRGKCLEDIQIKQINDNDITRTA